MSGPYAPLDRPGPPLSVPAGTLRAALSCTPGIAGDTRNPILLVPGTNLDPGPNYSWNYERAFAAMHWAYCSITLPYHTTGDIQTAGEYVVYALRTIAKLSGRQVDVLGYSQGGMLPRWALRFWPDTRALVHDFVSLDPSNHGTLDADATCQGQCSAADWQQASTAHFMSALNSFTETFAGIDYTVIFSRTDEIVVPNFNSAGSSSLHTGGGTIANIAVQQICPTDTSEHLAMGSYNSVGYALAVDAFTHESVADRRAFPPRCVAAVPAGRRPEQLRVGLRRLSAGGRAGPAERTPTRRRASAPVLRVRGVPDSGCAQAGKPEAPPQAKAPPQEAPPQEEAPPEAGIVTITDRCLKRSIEPRPRG